jgi:hypothetical protein
LRVVRKATGKSSEREWTPAEIRAVLLQLARRQIDERVARPAIDALNKILRGATAPQPLQATQGKQIK